MAIPSVYINLEDDISKITTRLKHLSQKQIVLVCPKRCFLFSDSINLRLLKKQADLLDKEIFILTMDEKGQAYAKEAGFQLKFLPKVNSANSFSDIKVSKKNETTLGKINKPGILASAVLEIKEVAKKLTPTVIAKLPEETVAAKPKVEVTETVFPAKNEMDFSKPPAKKSYMQKIIVAVTAVSLLLILLLIFVVLPKATVVVYPRTEPVTRDMEISLSSAASSPDTSKLILPASKIDESINVSDSFQSQGKKQVGNRASGTVKIYNFTKLPINLKSSTTVLTVGGKNFNLLNDVSGLKPAVYKNAKTKEVDEASLGESVEIIATEGGEDSNLPSGTRLEITNQVFGSKPQFLFAKTDSEIKGGTTRYLSVIAQEDANAAQAQLLDKAVQQIKNKLLVNGQILVDKAYTILAPSFSTDNPVGSETPSYQATLQARVVGLSFKKSDLTSLIFNRINETLDTNKTLRAKNPDQTVYKIKSLDINNELAVLDVHFEGQAVFNLNLPYIAPELVGKSQNQVNEILRSKAEIDRVDITLAPSWQKNFPLFSSKINVSIGRDEAVNSQ